MTDMDVAVAVVKGFAPLAEWQGEQVAEQILLEWLTDHPTLPWSIAINGLADESERFKWAKRALHSYERLN